MALSDISNKEIEALCKKLEDEAKAGGYFLNPDHESVKDLAEGLIINKKRYGHFACPCRLADGIKDKDLDIVCPCYYRDPDLEEFDACYCSLYVSERAYNGEIRIKPVPERRGTAPLKKEHVNKDNDVFDSLKYPVWRCQVCGYLAARDNPPGKCPVCKADKERFERFL